MNEVEKMYRNCGIENYRLENYSGFVPDGYIIIDDENKEGYVKEIVRDFNSEKQLSLIKWIAEYKEECRITYEKEYKWCTQTDWQSSFCYDNFPASLANLINNLWQDLTEEEKQQVKGILE